MSRFARRSVDFISKLALAILMSFWLVWIIIRLEYFCLLLLVIDRIPLKRVWMMSKLLFCFRLFFRVR